MHKWSICEMDVKCAFLNEPLDEEVHVTHPVGFVKDDQEKKAYMLHKILYGLKQAPRAWNKKIDDFLREKEFENCSIEHVVYARRSMSELIILCLYVDNLLITGSCKKKIEDFKHDLSKEFEMSYLGNFSYFLGIKFYKSDRGLMMHQRRYTGETLKRFEKQDCNLTSTSVESRL